MPRSKATNYIESDDSPPIGADTLNEEIQRLKQREKLVVRKSLAMEMELQSVLADRDMYKRKYLEARGKLDQLSSNPFPVAVVEKLIVEKDRRAVVRLVSGQMFVCQVDPNLEVHEGDTVALHQRSMSIIEVLPPFTDPSISAMELFVKPSENYTDIGGLKHEIQIMREVVELSLTHPETFINYNISPPRGILLYGPPGTGKTLLAKAAANAAKAQFYYLAAPELVQKFIGEGARLVRELFNKAREFNTPTIIFIDEIDAIAAKRSSDNQSGEREVNRTLMQLLAELDGFSQNDNVRLIAATNRIDILDPAILRPGRFDRLLELPLPDYEGRQQIFKIHLKKMPKQGIKFEELAFLTEGFSGADIKAICTEGAMIAIREHLDKPSKTNKKIEQVDFIAAIQEFKEKREKNTYGSVSQIPLYS